ncbi:MAG: ATP-binding protein [Lutibacter sp.]
MVKKKYEIGKKYTSRQLMELAVQLMHDSIPEHIDRADPKVGAVLAKENGVLVNIAYRGELRQGDHAEFTVLERKHRTDKLDGFIIYATLEPCAPGARSITKLGCAERIVNARIKKAYIGIEDPDPKVKGNGIAYLLQNKIEIDFFDKDLQEEILITNSQFLSEAAERAKLAEQEEIEPAFTELDKSLDNYNLKDFSTDALEKFKEKLQLSYPVDSKNFRSVLHKWNFLRIDKKTNTIRTTGLGLLLFGKNPQINYPQSLVKFTIKKQNEDKPKILDFDGPLILMPEKIESYLEINFPKAMDRSSFARKEINEVYFEVLREVIINAIVHRDYTIEQANINVKIDDEKILVESPGKPLVSLEKLQDFTAPTFSVNPKIANVFYQMKFIEKRNIGMEELHHYSEIMGVNKPTIEYNEPYLQVKLWRKSETKLEPTKDDIIEFVKVKSKVSSGDYADKFGGSTKTASRHLNELVDEGIFEREGEKKGTRYFLKK